MRHPALSRGHARCSCTTSERNSPAAARLEGLANAGGGRAGLRAHHAAIRQRGGSLRANKGAHVHRAACFSFGDTRPQPRQARGRKETSAPDWGLKAKHLSRRLSCGQGSGPSGFPCQFGFRIRNEASGIMRCKRHQTVIVADHQVPGGDAAASDHDGQVDGATVCPGGAAWVDPARIDGEVIPGAQGSGCLLYTSPSPRD